MLRLAIDYRSASTINTIIEVEWMKKRLRLIILCKETRSFMFLKDQTKNEVMKRIFHKYLETSSNLGLELPSHILITPHHLLLRHLPALPPLTLNPILPPQRYPQRRRH